MPALSAILPSFRNWRARQQHAERDGKRGEGGKSRGDRANSSVPPERLTEEKLTESGGGGGGSHLALARQSTIGENRSIIG